MDSALMWGRPLDWPRIDLIPMRGLPYHVIYLLARKPSPGHGLLLRADAGSGTWYIERVAVSSDGRTVTPIEGSRQTSAGDGATSIDYQFPAGDPVGTVYAMRIGTTDPASPFLLCPFVVPSAVYPSSWYEGYISGVVLEWIVRTPGISAFAFCGGSNIFAGPAHVAVYHADQGLKACGVRCNYTLRFVEFREGSVITFDDSNRPSFSSVSAYNAVIADWDDDLTVRLNPANQVGRLLPYNPRTGGIYPLSRYVSTVDGQPLGWASVKSVYGMLSFQVRATGLELPPGFGVGATVAQDAFSYSHCLQSLDLPEGFGSVATNVQSCFNGCTSLQSLDLPEGFGSVATAFLNCFFQCTRLRDLVLPEGFGAAATNVSNCFFACASLTNVTGAIKFPISFDMHWSTNLTHDSLMNIINGLVTVTSARTFTMGATNKAKLSSEEIAVATAKGWTIA